MGTNLFTLANRVVPSPPGKNKQTWLHSLGTGRLSFKKALVASFIFVFISWIGLFVLVNSGANQVKKFDGERAWQDVDYQTRLGPRIPGSRAHTEAVEWIQAELEEAGWQVEVQEATMMGNPIKNIIARRQETVSTDGSFLILGAHYDSRIFADRDLDLNERNLPVPGANDGASGVAVLLELSRILPEELPKDVWLVFFDAEDNGNIPGWDWILGSRAFVNRLERRPESAIIVDMIGDADLNIYMERNSDEDLLTSIWDQAEALGYEDKFIPSYKYSILDDHTPFLEAGIPAADLIDFDYPYWHTTEDTSDKVSAESLQAVGDTLFAWLTKSDESDPNDIPPGVFSRWFERWMLLFRRERVQ